MLESVLKLLASIADSVEGLRPTPEVSAEKAARMKIRNEVRAKRAEAKKLRVEKKVRRLKKKLGIKE